MDELYREYILDHYKNPRNFGELEPHDVAEICNREAVCIRAGHHCAQPLMRRLGVQATARASFHVYNTREDVDRLIGALEKAHSIFHG